MLAMSNEEIEEIKRHFGVVAESLRSDIRRLPKGMPLFGMNWRVSEKR